MVCVGTDHGPVSFLPGRWVADPAFTYTAQNLDVVFTNLSTGTFPLDYQWDFGDGITSTAISPLHTYALSGTYTVTLTAVELCGTGI